MKIDFNNVRRGAIANYSALVKQLNAGLNSSNGEGMVVVSADDIQEIMDDLRSDLVGIGATHQPDDPDFICVLEEGKTIPCFNPSEEEES
jgi:predicted MPP superfamily phosphohydrolase